MGDLLHMTRGMSGLLVRRSRVFIETQTVRLSAVGPKRRYLERWHPVLVLEGRTAHLQIRRLARGMAQKWAEVNRK
jgi:hypothetical protein